MAFFSNDDDEVKSEIRSLKKRLDEQDIWYKECQYAKDELAAFKDFTESLEAEKEQLISKINLQHAIICRLRRKIEKIENSNKDDEVFLKLN